jgi:hypothetical protein
VAVALADRTLAQLAEASTEVSKLRDRLDEAQHSTRTAEERAAELEGEGPLGSAQGSVAGRMIDFLRGLLATFFQ